MTRVLIIAGSDSGGGAGIQTEIPSHKSYLLKQKYFYSGYKEKEKLGAALRFSFAI